MKRIKGYAGIHSKTRRPIYESLSN